MKTLLVFAAAATTAIGPFLCREDAESYANTAFGSVGDDEDENAPSWAVVNHVNPENISSISTSGEITLDEPLTATSDTNTQAAATPPQAA